MTLLPLVFAAALLAVETNTNTTPPTPSSAFGTLNDESSQNRTVLDMHGQDVDDYVRLLNEYETLNAQLTSAYGAQRTALQEQALARAKDVLLAKLGSAETHLKNLIQRLGSLNLLTDTDRQLLNSELASFQGFMDEVRADIDVATTTAELRLISLTINTETLESFGLGNYYAVKLSIQKGLAIVEALVARADLVQAHIDSSGELGGDVAGIQTRFDAAMLSLENAKTSYQAIDTALAGINPSNTTAVQTQFTRVRDVNVSVSKAQADLKQVVAELLTLYGRSPWTINLEEGQ